MFTLTKTYLFPMGIIKSATFVPESCFADIFQCEKMLISENSVNAYPLLKQLFIVLVLPYLNCKRQFQTSQNKSHDFESCDTNVLYKSKEFEIPLNATMELSLKVGWEA